jgi:hypothetical protein
VRRGARTSQPALQGSMHTLAPAAATQLLIQRAAVNNVADGPKACRPTVLAVVSVNVERECVT